MYNAVELNQYTDIMVLQRAKERNQRTMSWIENKLFKYLEDIARQGEYSCYLPIAQKYYVGDNDYFEIADCPKDGINISLVTRTLTENGFHVEHTSFSYFVSWDSKYIY